MKPYQYISNYLIEPLGSNPTSFGGNVMYGLIFGIAFGLIGLLLSGFLAGRKTTIEPAEIIDWSGKGMWQSLFNREHIQNSVGVGLSSSCIISLAYYLSYQLLFGWNAPDQGILTALNTCLSYVLLIGLSYWLLIGLVSGLDSKTLEKRIIPNQGIRRSTRNGALIGLLIGFITWFVYALTFGLSKGLNAGLQAFGLGLYSSALDAGLNSGLSTWLISIHGYALSVGLIGGLLGGLLFGWLACIQHVILRVLLWRTGDAPLDYPHFLDYTEERILMQKAGGGGGYRFFYELLRAYFASGDIVP